jgi:hypothetical protein
MFFSPMKHHKGFLKYFQYKKEKMLILILCILHTVFAQQTPNNKFSLAKNFTVITSSTWSIRSSKARNKLHCLAECNLNTNCYTVVFIPVSESNDNCYLYNKYFDFIEIVPSENSDLYKKECKFLFYIN